MKRYSEFQNLVGVKIVKNTNLSEATPVRFEHENLRSICPKREEGASGNELLLADHDKGRVYCRSIFIQNKPGFLFGYDLKDISLRVERN